MNKKNILNFIAGAWALTILLAILYGIINFTIIYPDVAADIISFVILATAFILLTSWAITRLLTLCTAVWLKREVSKMKIKGRSGGTPPSEN